MPQYMLQGNSRPRNDGNGRSVQGDDDSEGEFEDGCILGPKAEAAMKAGRQQGQRGRGRGRGGAANSKRQTDKSAPMGADVTGAPSSTVDAVAGGSDSIRYSETGINPVPEAATATPPTNESWSAESAMLAGQTCEENSTHRGFNAETMMGSSFAHGQRGRGGHASSIRIRARGGGSARRGNEPGRGGGGGRGAHGSHPQTQYPQRAPHRQNHSQMPDGSTSLGPPMGQHAVEVRPTSLSHIHQQHQFVGGDFGQQWQASNAWFQGIPSNQQHHGGHMNHHQPFDHNNPLPFNAGYSGVPRNDNYY
eukprot:Selendium_serpulae@DN10057_c0_g1_i1.p1